MRNDRRRVLQFVLGAFQMALQETLSFQSPNGFVKLPIRAICSKKKINALTNKLRILTPF